MTKQFWSVGIVFVAVTIAIAVGFYPYAGTEEVTASVTTTE